MRRRYLDADHDHESRAQVEDLRARLARRPGNPVADELVEALIAQSPEFAELWTQHDVAVRRSDRKRILHPSIGLIELDFDILSTDRQDQRLIMYSPATGSEAVSQLELLGVLGRESFVLP